MAIIKDGPVWDQQKYVTTTVDNGASNQKLKKSVADWEKILYLSSPKRIYKIFNVVHLNLRSIVFIPR